MKEKEIFFRTAATVVATALFELYPNIELKSSREISFGFSSHFFFPHPISEEMQFQIEEKVRQIVREKRPIRTLEMVPLSARELLRKEGHRHRAQELVEGQQGLVYVAQIGSFYDRASGPLLKNTMELGACKILSLKQEGKRSFRIVGTARRSKAELKDFLKRWAAYPKTRHEVLGEKSQFWQICEEGLLWLPRGIEVRQKLFERLKESLNASWMERPPGIEWKELCRLGEPLGEVLVEQSPYDEEKGLFDGGRQTILRVVAYSESVAKTLLQTIRKTLMMLGFTLNEKVGTNFLTEDGLGRLWSAASFSLQKGFWICSIPVERNLALLIEKDHCKGTVFEN